MQDIKTGKLVATFSTVYGSVSRIALNADGSYLAAITVSNRQYPPGGSRIYTLYAWNVATGRQVFKRDIDVQRGESSAFVTRRLTLQFRQGTTLLSSSDVDDDDRIDDHLTLTNAATGNTISTRP